MAQALSATAMSPERAFELARTIERRLGERADAEIDVAALHTLAEEVLLAEEGDTAVKRYRRWRRLDRLDRPLVVLIGGTTGVGKSTLATMLAARLGINRVIATDVIRQVLRAFFTPRPCRPFTTRPSRRAGSWATATRPSGWARASRRSWSARPTRPSRWWWRGCTWCPAASTRACASAACWWRRSWWSRIPTCTEPTSAAPGHAPGRALPRPLRGHPPPPGPPLGAGALGERGDHRQRAGGRHPGPPDGAGAGRGARGRMRAGGGPRAPAR